MKKVLFIGEGLGIGGSEVASVNIANGLANADFDVTILIQNPKFDLANLLDKRVNLIYKPDDKHLGNRIPYIRRKYFDVGMWNNRASPKRLYKYYVGRENYDIEIAFFHRLPVKIICGSTNKNTLRIAWIHNDFGNSTAAEYYSKQYYLKEGFSKCDKIVCVSKSALNGFEEKFGESEKTVIIYNLLPINKIQQNALASPTIKINKKKFNLCVVGRLSNGEKGQIRLIDAVSKLHQEGLSISLTIVGGEGLTKKEIYDRVEQNNASEFITITGNVVNPYPYIKQSDLLVCSSYTDGYNLTVAESLIIGTPVLSTNCSGPNEILDYGKYGMVVDNSYKGIYSGIKKLYNNPDMLEYYKDKAKQRLNFFDNHVIMKQIVDLFSDSKS